MDIWIYLNLVVLKKSELTPRYLNGNNIFIFTNIFPAVLDHAYYVYMYICMYIY